MSKKTKRLLELYENHLELHYSEKTAASYRGYVAAFIDWVSEQGLELVDLQSSDLSSYQNVLVARKNKSGKPYALGSHRNHLVAVKSLFRFLFENGYLLHDPARAVELRLKENRLPRVILTKREVRRLLDSAIEPEPTPRGLRDRAILETLYATGIRSSELAALSLADVDTRERVLHVALGKGRKGRNVPLTPVAAEALDRYLECGRGELTGSERSPLLFLADKGGRLHDAVLNKMIGRYTKRAGLKKHVTCHTFRHSVATHLLSGQADIRHIQKLLGHRSLQTTQRYTRVEISDLRKVIARAHPRS